MHTCNLNPGRGAGNPELLGAALAALEDDDMTGECEACGWETHNGVCPECLVDGRLRYDLEPVRAPLWRRALLAVWTFVCEEIREDFQTHKRLVAERRAREHAAKTVVIP
jgi:hypothetical protein